MVTLARPTSLPKETLFAIAATLPADLRVLSKLADTLKDPNSDLDDVARVLRRDVTLAAKILQISNSAAYGRGRAISTTEDAVNVVGFGEILKLVGTVTAARLSESALHCYDVQARLLRDNMLYGAFAAEALARPAGIDPRIAYNAGLLRSVGLMVLDRAGRRDAATSPLYSSSRWPDFVSWETAVFGLPSTDVTALILDHWGFPAELTQGIRSHYITEPGDAQDPLAALLNLANGLAQRVSRSFHGEDPWWDITPEKLAAAHLTEADFGPAVVATEEAFEAANSALAA